MTTFVPEGEIVPVRDHSEIVKRYYEDGLLCDDLIAWVPIVFFLDNSEESFFRLFYLLKIVRIKRAFAAFDVSAMIMKIKDVTKSRMLIKI